MTVVRRLLVAVTVGLAALLGGVPPAAAQPAGQGDCEISIIMSATESGRPGRLVVTVRNRGRAGFGPVTVELWRADTRITAVPAGPLVPGESTVIRVPAPEETAGAYLVVRYQAGGVRRDFAVAVPVSGGGAGPGGAGPDGVPGAGFLAWFTPLLGFAGALAGVWLGHVTTARRERARMAADAQWKRVDRDGPAYRAFLDYWQGSTSASHLEAAFAQLRSAASVPAEVTREYEQTLGVLRDAGVSEGAKRAAATRLRDAVDALRTDRG